MASGKKQSMVGIFNQHFMEFVADIQSIFPTDSDILVAQNSFLALKKANPALIIKIWRSFIVDKYRAEIEAGDITFFIDKDYSEDMRDAQNSDKISDAINRLREPIRRMEPENREKTMKYIQNLTKIALM